MYRLSTGTFFIFYFVAGYTFRVTLGLRDQTHYFLVKLVKFAVHACMRVLRSYDVDDYH